MQNVDYYENLGEGERALAQVSKVRIYELAKKLGLKSTVILTELSKLGIMGKCNFSCIDPEIAMKIEEALLKKDVEPPDKVILTKEKVSEETNTVSSKKISEAQGGATNLKLREFEILSKIEKTKAAFSTEKGENSVVLEKSRDIKEGLVPEVKNVITQKNNYCPICNKHIDKYGRGKNDAKIPSWIFCPTHGWFQYEKDKEELEIIEHTDTQLKREDITKQTKKTVNFMNNFIIVGLVIIIALFAVLFVINNDFAPSRPVQRTPEMKPHKSQVLLSEPVRHLDTVISEPAQMIIASDGKTETEKEVKGGILFTVQVGAFNDLFRAMVLKAKLDKSGYEVYITPSLSKNGRIYKVYIGTFSDREKAESNSKEIKQSEGLQTFVTKMIGT